MNVLWSYFWPMFGVGLVAGLIAGLFAFRALRTQPKDRLASDKISMPAGWKRRRTLTLGIGLALSWVAAALWHGPLGAADRFTQRVDHTAREALDYYEMTKVTAHLQHGPLTRRLILSGPADDFQHSELVRLLSQLPGVSSAQWSGAGTGVPLIVEGWAVSLLGFLIGLLLAYLVELRRRYNAQWNW
jgi:hypothetical protein